MKKLKVLFVMSLFQLLVVWVNGQQPGCNQTMEESLQQIAEILNKPQSKELWDVPLNAPIIMIDHFKNTVYFTAIENDTVKAIREEQWDNKIPLANSFFEYNGERCVTVIYAAFMNASCDERVNLLTHEIFHLNQTNIGIGNALSANYHIDEVQGRALLRIEMKALQQALDGDSLSLREALCIRAYRQHLYPDNNEDVYELNEGLAEYTGVKLSTTNMIDYVKNRLNYDISRGYTNAFGYFTGSAYATLLDRLYPKWRYDKDLNKGMIFLIKKWKPQYSNLLNEVYLATLLNKYNYIQLLSDEKEELEKFGDIAQFEALLKPETQKLCITNNKINFTYNPHDRVIMLKDAVLLRNMTVMGDWGQLKARSGIVRLNNWSAFYLLPPKKIEGAIVEGDDYEIRMNQGWKMVEEKGVYKIVEE